MVTIFLGPSCKKFVLHKKLVCKEAPYFDKMFNGSFEESKTLQCYLEDEEPSTFEVFVSYIYTRHFPDDVPRVSGNLAAYDPIVKFFVLADKLLMSKAAKDASLDALVRDRAKRNTCFSETTIEFVLARTASDCPLRKLVVDLTCRDFLVATSWDQDKLLSCFKDMTFEQTKQLLLTMKSFVDKTFALKEDPCKKMARERCSITKVPEYQIGYLKIEQQPSAKKPKTPAA